MRLAIAVPALDVGPTAFAFALARMYAETRAVVPVVTLAEGAGFVHHARENLLHEVVELWGATHVLWLDTDMVFPPDTAVRLLRHNLEIVAANYTTRRAPIRPTAKRHGQPVTSEGARGLEEVEHVGMGVFLMHAAVVAGLPRPRFWYSTPTETEDVYFCKLVRAAGHRIYVDHDLSHEVGHVGQQTHRMTPTAVPVHD